MSPPVRARLRRLRFALLGIAATVVILLGIAAGVVQLALPWLERNPGQVERWLSERLQRPVRIGHVDGAWIGGGPVLVRERKPVYRSNEAFTTSQIAPRNPRSAVGQLGDGRIVLVVVDGRQAGYSVGMTTFEMAQTLVRLGAVAGMGLDSGGSSTLAFEGALLNRPSAGRERAISTALMLQYFGVYAAPPAEEVVSPNGDGAAEEQRLSFKVVRPSTVTTTLTAPDGSVAFQESLPREPGSYGVAWFGMRINTFANSRTAFASLSGRPLPVYSIPLESGMSIGMLLISVELFLMLCILLFVPGEYAGPCFIGFAIGESLGAASRNGSRKAAASSRRSSPSGRLATIASSEPATSSSTSTAVIDSRTVICAFGKRSSAAARSPGSTKGAIDGMTPSRIGPLSTSPWTRASSSSSRTAARMPLERAATSRPKAVRRAPAEVRSTTTAPSAASSSRICMESAGWLTPMAAAARPK